MDHLVYIFHAQEIFKKSSWNRTRKKIIWSKKRKLIFSWLEDGWGHEGRAKRPNKGQIMCFVILLGRRLFFITSCLKVVSNTKKKLLCHWYLIFSKLVMTENMQHKFCIALHIENIFLLVSILKAEKDK